MNAVSHMPLFPCLSCFHIRISDKPEKPFLPPFWEDYLRTSWISDDHNLCLWEIQSCDRVFPYHPFASLHGILWPPWIPPVKSVGHNFFFFLKVSSFLVIITSAMKEFDGNTMPYFQQYNKRSPSEYVFAADKKILWVESCSEKGWQNQ